MKLVFIMILSTLYGNMQAQKYYVSQSGSNGNAGTSTGTSWANISKINSSSFSSNDSILFKRGDTIYADAMLNVNHANLHFGAYGTGNGPIISGFTNVTLTDSSHFWNATVPGAVAYLNTVMVGDTIRAKGQYPNTGYIGALGGTISSFYANASLGGIDYTGAEVAITNYRWIWDVCGISSQTVDTINLVVPMTYAIAGFGYFRIQNSLKVLDLPNEYYWDSLHKKLYVYSLTTPVRVKASVLDTLVKVHNLNNVTFDNILFEGANKIGISADTLSGTVIRNCVIRNIGANGIYLNKAPLTTVDSDSLYNIWNDGIYVRQQSDSCTFKNNNFKKIGLGIGMGLSGNAAYMGIFAYGDRDSAYHNTVDSIGYIGIQLSGLNTLTKYNYVQHYLLDKDDGGGIYSTVVLSNVGARLTHNIVGNAPGFSILASTPFGAPGIYMDNYTSGETIDSNTVFNTYRQNFAFQRNDMNVHHNTFDDSIGINMNIPGGISMASDTIVHNIFYQRSTANHIYTAGTVPSSSIIDSNKLFRFAQQSNQIKLINTFYSIAGWQTNSGKETHSDSTISNITASPGRLFINPTLTDSTVYFSGLYLDANGTQYNNSATMEPFGSRLLFKANYEITNTLRFKIGGRKFQ